jgi:hypothetical protein
VHVLDEIIQGLYYLASVHTSRCESEEFGTYLDS